MQHLLRQNALSNSLAPWQNSLIFIIIESYIFRQGGIKKSQNYLIFCLRKQVFKKKTGGVWNLLKRLSYLGFSPKQSLRRGVWCGYFILEVILRHRNEAVERVEQSRRTVRRCIIKATLEACRIHPELSTTSAGSCLSLLKVASGQCASMAAGSYLSAREDLGENQVEITVIPSRCNRGHQRTS